MKDREKYNLIDGFEEIRSKRNIPNPKQLRELRYIKKRRREQRFEDNGGIDVNSKDYKLAHLISDKCSKYNKEKRLNEIINKIKEMQKIRHMNDFSRNFLNQLLDSYTKLTDRTKQRRIKEILDLAIYKNERLIQSKRHHFSGCYCMEIEKTQYYEVFYSFV